MMEALSMATEGMEVFSYPEFVRKIDEDSLVDDNFRKELLSNDQERVRMALNGKYGINIVQDIKVKVHEDREDEYNIVLSPKSHLEDTY